MVACIVKPEFAPQYSRRERWHRLVLHSVLGLLILGALYWWVWPRYRALSADAPCESIFGVSGATVLLYGAFVAAPLAAAILLVALTARTSIHAIATRRYPPPGQKVFGRVKVKKGWQAVAFALVPAMLITYLCVLSSQGMATAAQMSRDAQRSANCDTDVTAPETPRRSRERLTPNPPDPRPSGGNGDTK